VALCTSHVAFFLLSQERHVVLSRDRIKQMERQWRGQIWQHKPVRQVPTLPMQAADLQEAVKRITKLEERLKALEDQSENR